MKPTDIARQSKNDSILVTSRGIREKYANLSRIWRKEIPSVAHSFAVRRSTLTNDVDGVVEHGHNKANNERCCKLSPFIPSKDMCRCQRLLKRREGLPECKRDQSDEATDKSPDDLGVFRG
jgi:hypothetical protein